MKSQITEMHYRPLPVLLNLLRPLEWGYGMAVSLRQWAYTLGFLKVTRVSVPVISVGNLTTGGTGKTPVVLALGDALLSLGYRVVILSRGYGAQVPLPYGRASHPRHGDEAYLLQQALPEAVVIVGKNRAANAQRACQEYQPDVILLDDGFQYLPLGRSQNIVLVDGEKGFGNEHLLPLGPLREPLSYLRRADTLWVTKEPNPLMVQALREMTVKHAGREIPVAAVPFAYEGLYSLLEKAPLSLEALQHRKIIAISGIAQPGPFEAALRTHGADILHHFKFGDHHDYTTEQLVNILSQCPTEAWIVTTEKDRVKLEGLLPESALPSVYTLKIQPVFNVRAFLHGIGFPDRTTPSSQPPTGTPDSGDALPLHRGHATHGSLSPEP